MRWFRWLSVPIILASVSPTVALTQQSQDPAPTRVEEPERKWPTFEPFGGAWGFAPTREERVAARSGAPVTIAAATARVREMIRGVEKFSAIAETDGALGGLSGETMWWRTVPACIETLELLVGDTEWNDEEVALANACADFLALTKHAPKLETTAVAKRQEQLWSLAAWFVEQTKDTSRYGRMIFTMYLGPYTGTAASPSADAKVHSSCVVDTDVELRLLETGQPGLRTLAAFRGDELSWARTLRFHDDGEAVGDLKFLSSKPRSLGSYGCVVAMSFGENVEVYLDADGKFLFYFLSW